MNQSINTVTPKISTFVSSDSIKAIKRRVILSLNVIALCGMILAIQQILTAKVGILEISLWLLMTTVTGIGTSVGYHRYFAHKSFKTRRFIEILLAICGSMSGQGALIAWVSVHRCHHQYSDVNGDPHSPRLHGDSFKGKLQGLWHAHMGWLLDDKLPNSMLFAKDILQDAVLNRISQLYFLWLALGFIIPTLLGGIITGTWHGALQGFIWGGLIRFVWSFHGGYTVNSIVHVYGRRWLKSKDQSRNNIWLAIPTFGEGWHNNHHAFPNSAKFGLKWWQIDLGYWFIQLLSLLGLVSEVKSPTIQMIEAKKLG
jgi:stearoyl-CoA desaturase (Delta-9 desaturase)